MIALFFDLDDTLFATSSFLSEARLEAAKQMIRAGLPELSAMKLKQSIEQVVARYGANYEKHFARLIEEYGLRPDPRIIAAGIVAYHNTKIARLRPDHRMKSILRKLKDSGYQLFLVSIGKPVKQWEKIHRLELETFFTEITILDEKEREGKKRTFASLIQKYDLMPAECVAIGDRLDIDIYPANSIGMRSVRILQGKRRHERPQSSTHQPTATIRSLEQLPAVLDRMAKDG